jgi:hypothetical protein
MTGYNALVTYRNVDVCHNALINNITETLSICDGFMTEQTISTTALNKQTSFF